MDVVVWGFDGAAGTDGPGWHAVLVDRLVTAGGRVAVVDPSVDDPLAVDADAHVLACGATTLGTTVGSGRALWHARRLVVASDRTGLPVVGVCLGAQVLAAALMGTVASGPCPAGPEVGVVEVVDAGGRGWRAATAHRHEVTPMLARVAGVAVVASNRHSRVQAFTRRAVSGVQFHPELSRGQLAAAVRAGAWGNDQLAGRVAAGPPVDSDTAARWLLGPLGLPARRGEGGPPAA